jgi:trigger factor
MRTSSEQLEDNKVKLTVEVDEEEVRQAESTTLRRLTQEVRIPGFRPGHVPRKVLQARLGAKALREEVLRDALPQYLSDAVDEAQYDVISTPEINVTEGEESGAVVFDAVLELRPKVSIAGYEGLVVTLPSPFATDDEINAQIDRLREQFATLNDVDRPARDGDLVTLDVEGTRDGEPAEGLTADDLLYQVGTGGIVAGIDEKLFGSKAGDEFEMDAPDAPDGPAHLRVKVKQVREKLLPEADDAWAADASEFETIAELRSDLASRVASMKQLQATLALRERAVESLTALVADEPPASLISNESQLLLQDFVHRLSHEGIGFDAYLAGTGQDADAFMASIEEQAAKQVKADLALRALVEAENIEVDESEMDEEIVRLAAQTGQKPADLRSGLETSGRLSGLRSEIANRKAINWLIEHVAIVDGEGNAVNRAAIRGGFGGEATHDHDHDHEGHDHDHDHDH